MLVCSDNLEYIKKLETDSIDFIYFDPPFNITEATYDKGLNWEELWIEMWRVLKKGKTIVIHSSQPFTFDLINSQRKYFRYCWYWNKFLKTGFLFSKKQPMRQVEEICVFYKQGHNSYYPQMKEKDKPTYSYGYKNCDYFKRGGKQKKKILTHSHPTHLLEYKSIKHKYSTRPFKLIEYILKTYTKEGDIVLDLTCSNGRTGIECKKLKREYIGVDINKKMIEDAKDLYNEVLKI